MIENVRKVSWYFIVIQRAQPVKCNITVPFISFMRELEVLYGEDVKALRKQVGLNQAQLAMRWGLTRQQIGRYEKTGQIVPAKEADAYRGLILSIRENAT